MRERPALARRRSRERVVGGGDGGHHHAPLCAHAGVALLYGGPRPPVAAAALASSVAGECGHSPRLYCRRSVGVVRRLTTREVLVCAGNSGAGMCQGRPRWRRTYPRHVRVVASNAAHHTVRRLAAEVRGAVAAYWVVALGVTDSHASSMWLVGTSVGRATGMQRAWALH